MCINHSFIVIVEQYFMIWMYYNLFHHSHIQRYLGCFKFCVINKATIKILINIFVRTLVSFFWIKEYKAGSQGNFISNFLRSYQTFGRVAFFPEWLQHFTFPPAIGELSYFAASLAEFDIITIFLFYPFQQFYNDQLWF